MVDDEQELLVLKSKSKLSTTEKARIKLLETKLRKVDRKDRESHGNVFATKPTTLMTPLPIRFSADERIGLRELANDIKSQSPQRVIMELGSERDINDTKLLRAALYLLKQHSHDEIIDAIKQVKLNMFR